MFIKVAVRELDPSTLILGRLGLAALDARSCRAVLVGGRAAWADFRAHWRLARRRRAAQHRASRSGCSRGARRGSTPGSRRSSRRRCRSSTRSSRSASSTTSASPADDCRRRGRVRRRRAPRRCAAAREAARRARGRRHGALLRGRRAADEAPPLDGAAARDLARHVALPRSPCFPRASRRRRTTCPAGRRSRRSRCSARSVPRSPTSSSSR